MGKLMKYEFRKKMFSKAVLLLITAAAELLYLLGIFLSWENGLGWGIVLLILCAGFGIFYIGIESILVFHRDLNTKQSYMLFLTPRNSYEILGAKVLESALVNLAAGVFFAALAAADYTIGILYIGGVKEFLDIINQLLGSISVNVDLSATTLLLTLFTAIASWLTVVVTGYLAVVLAATVLAGKRLSGLVSFLIYLALVWIFETLLELMPHMENLTLEHTLQIIAALVVTAVMYLAAGWIMERRLSV